MPCTNRHNATGRRLALKSLRSALLALACGVTSALGAASAADGPRRSTVDLAHRTVAELRQMVDPVVDDDVQIGGDAQMLVLKAPADHLSELKALIQRLDRPRQRLRISLLQRPHPISPSDRTADDAFRSQHRYSTRSANKGERHVIQAVEGQPAKFDTSVAVPVVERDLQLGKQGVTSSKRVRYKRVANGLGVTVRPLADGQVMIHVAAALDRAANDGNHGNRTMRIDRGRTITTVRGKPGRWLAISANDAAERGAHGEATSYSTRTLEGGNRYVYLKVERLSPANQR